MFCSSCGTEIPRGASFCPACGKPIKRGSVIAFALALLGGVVVMLLLTAYWDRDQSTGSPTGPILSKTKLTPGEIASRAAGAVVVIENYNLDGEQVGRGSGFVLSSDGAVITNYHVIRGAARAQVRIPTGTSYDAD